MADEATRAVGVPPGMPVGWVAPESAILDPGDLQTMRDGLRAGKTVAIASDGHVYVSGDATGQPMTPQAQQFIESRLGVVKQLVDMSGGMTIQPDGRMFGTFANQSIKVAMGPDPSLDQDEMNLVHAGIASGATVAVLPDGSVQYQLQPGTQPPSAEDAQQRMAYFDEEVASGRLGTALSAGHAVRMSGDVYQTMPPPTTPNGMQFPRGGDPDPSAAPTTPPLPGATPEATVGPPTTADATPPAPEQTTPAPDQTAPTAAQTVSSGDAVGDTAVATADPTPGDAFGADGAALAYDDASSDTPVVDTGDPMPSEAYASTDGASTDAGAYDGGGDGTSAYDGVPGETGVDASYVASDDAYAGSYDTGSSDDAGSYDASPAYANSYDTGSTYDAGSYDTGSTYDAGSDDTGSAYDAGSYDGAAADGGGGDSYAYAANDDGSTYDAGTYDASGYDSSGYGDSGSDGGGGDYSYAGDDSSSYDSSGDAG